MGACDHPCYYYEVAGSPYEPFLDACSFAHTSASDSKEFGLQFETECSYPEGPEKCPYRAENQDSD